jgi:hypothetical protein
MSHYHAFMRIGEPVLVGKGRPAVDPVTRFRSRYIEDPDTGCWVWQGYINPEGYGGVFVVNKGQPGGAGPAYRMGYQLLIGPIPEGLHLDHTCHTEDPTCGGGRTCLHRRCVNPSHLDPVTPRENVHRSLRHRAA